MSVPVGMRSESKLVAQVKANELAKYTLEITSNQRVFSPRFDALTRRIVDNAFGIGQSIWMANDINVRSAWMPTTRAFGGNRMINRVKDLAAQREIERLSAENERQRGILDYVAMMADVEIPVEEDEQHE